MPNLVYERSHETDFQISQAINKYPVPSRAENSSVCCPVSGRYQLVPVSGHLKQELNF